MVPSERDENIRGVESAFDDFCKNNHNEVRYELDDSQIDSGT